MFGDDIYLMLISTSVTTIGEIRGSDFHHSRENREEMGNILHNRSQLLTDVSHYW